jgi:hypothetical protein
VLGYCISCVVDIFIEHNYSASHTFKGGFLSSIRNNGYGTETRN